MANHRLFEAGNMIVIPLFDEEFFAGDYFKKNNPRGIKFDLIHDNFKEFLNIREEVPLVVLQALTLTSTTRYRLIANALGNDYAVKLAHIIWLLAQQPMGEPGILPIGPWIVFFVRHLDLGPCPVLTVCDKFGWSIYGEQLNATYEIKAGCKVFRYVSAQAAETAA